MGFWRVLVLNKSAASLTSRLRRDVTRALTRAGAETSTRPSKEIARKIKPKARRSGAAPAEPLRTGSRFFRRARLSSFDFSRSVFLLNFASFGRLWQTDYTKYDELVGALQLSALELAILNCYMNGMVQSEVCAELGIGRGKINSRKASIRQRYYNLYETL